MSCSQFIALCNYWYYLILISNLKWVNICLNFELVFLSSSLLLIFGEKLYASIPRKFSWVWYKPFSTVSKGMYLAKRTNLKCQSSNVSPLTCKASTFYLNIWFPVATSKPFIWWYLIRASKARIWKCSQGIKKRWELDEEQTLLPSNTLAPALFC